LGNIEGLSSVHGVYAYMDDLSIYADYRTLDKIARKLLPAIFASIGLEVSDNKYRFVVGSSVRGKDVEDWSLNGNPFYKVAESGGQILLGTPCGKYDFMKAEVQDMIASLSRYIPRLSELSDWVSWNLLHHCLSAKVGYLALVVERRFSMEALLRFDADIDRLLQLMLDAGPMDFPLLMESGILYSLRSLPLRLGGLGIPRFSGLAGEVGVLLSRSACYRSVAGSSNNAALGRY
jgi:hypothetical protein